MHYCHCHCLCLFDGAMIRSPDDMILRLIDARAVLHRDSIRRQKAAINCLPFIISAFPFWDSSEFF